VVAVAEVVAAEAEAEAEVVAAAAVVAAVARLSGSQTSVTTGCRAE